MKQSCKIAAWLLFFATTALSLVPPSYRLVTMLPHGLEHLVAFLLTGLAFGLGYANRYVFATLFLIAFVALIEVTQLFVPGRHARISDFFIDAIAVIVGAGLIHVAALHKPRSINEK